jgi:hypothetical protein
MTTKLTKTQRAHMAEWLNDRAAELRTEANRIGNEAEAASLSRYGRGYDEALAADQRSRDLQWQADDARARAAALLQEAALLQDEPDEQQPAPAAPEPPRVRLTRAQREALEKIEARRHGDVSHSMLMRLKDKSYVYSGFVLGTYEHVWCLTDAGRAALRDAGTGDDARDATRDGGE